jgi:hypothetical protein
MSNFESGPVRLAMLVSVLAVGIYLGYQWPRDLELESTRPVEISYEITPEAARQLVARTISGFPKCEP